ncbi:MAG: nuclear transport factor 2 family protein [Acidimicrobiales bacterium]
MTAKEDLMEAIVERLVALNWAGLAELYRPDALLDANVPEWRYQLQGRGAIRAQFEQEAAEAGTGTRVTWWRAVPTGDGVVVEVEARFDHDGEERLWRQVNILRTDGEAVTAHILYCTGIWDAATIARQAVEAPMVAP